MQDKYFYKIPTQFCIVFSDLLFKYGINSEEELKKAIYNNSVWEFSKEFSIINGIDLDETNCDYIEDLFNEYYGKDLEKNTISLINKYREAKEELKKEWSDLYE